MKRSGNDNSGNNDPMRPELSELIKRTSFGLDENRPDAIARRRAKNQRTARSNVEDLCDPDSLIEYDALAIAAQRSRRTEDELLAKAPADGLIAGIGSVNGGLFGEENARCMVMAYDYTVLAGTQGHVIHKRDGPHVEAGP
jgi:acetyl-CoA carboxylase carboxyltransferase component